LQVAKALAAESAKTAVRWKVFVTMLILITINYVDRASLSVAMPLIAAEFKLSPTMQGLILSSFFWTYALLQIPGGMLADRFKPRVVIASSTILWGTFQFLAAICSNGTSLVLTRLGLGAAEAPIYPAGGKLNGARARPRRNVARWRRSIGCGSRRNSRYPAHRHVGILAYCFRHCGWRNGAGRCMGLALHPEFTCRASRCERSRNGIYRGRTPARTPHRACDIDGPASRLL
jgi:Major Facilitator Superfamily